MGECKTCCHYAGDSHKCAPAWNVWRPDEQEQEDSRIFYSYNPEVAVEDWAEYDDAQGADYRIVGGSEATVHVRPRGDTATEPLVFIVHGEQTATYRAYAKK